MRAEQARRVLVVGEVEGCGGSLGRLLHAEGFEPLLAADGPAARELARQSSPAVVVLDCDPDRDHAEVLAEARQLNQKCPVIMLSASEGLTRAVAAMKNRAYECLTKPFENNELILRVRRAVQNRCSYEEGHPLGCAAPGQEALAAIMGHSDHVARIWAEVERVAPTDFTVIITGETGAGKEVVAQTIHRLSGRAAAPFVPVDCGSIAASLMESELFGHDKGAFTGAVQSRLGKFELAASGTLFLDEISNLPLSLQAKLLRALQEKQICRVGGKTCRKVDIRVVTATNRDLGAMVAAREFRQDLYHRLNEFAIRVPALRERREDIPFLVARFLERTNKELNKNVRGLTQEALAIFQKHSWPGNVRELRNTVRRAVLLADTEIGLEHLRLSGWPPAISSGRGAGSGWNHDGSLRQFVRRKIEELERHVLVQVLEETGGNKARAARMLQIDYKTIQTKVRQYGISC